MPENDIIKLTRTSLNSLTNQKNSLPLIQGTSEGSETLELEYLTRQIQFYLVYFWACRGEDGEPQIRYQGLRSSPLPFTNNGQPLYRVTLESVRNRKYGSVNFLDEKLLKTKKNNRMILTTEEANF